MNKIYHGDWMTNDIPDKSINLIIADPPYFRIKGAFDFAWESFDDYLKNVERWAVECKRVLSEDGTLFWWGHAKNIAYSQVILDKHFKLENSLVWKKIDGKTLKNCPTSMRTFAPVTERLLMYSSEGTSLSNDAQRRYMYGIGMARTKLLAPACEYLIGERDKAGYTNSMIDEALSTCMSSHWFCRTSQFCFPTKEAYKRLRELFNGEHLKKEYEDLKKEYEDLRRPFDMGSTLITDVLEYTQESHITKNYDHDTKKPETLTRMLIRTCSRPGDIVLAPFAGSGTECAMAAREGRRFIGYDIEKKYVDMATIRCNKAMQQTRIDFNT
jgi:site-specific DNA-methyltransferase (adenine-specific)